MSHDNDEEMNYPDMNKVAFDVALESMATIYKSLRKKDLSRADSAAIVAAMIKSDDPPSTEQEENA